MASSSATTRQGAARLTRASQVATIALAAVGVAAFVFGIPGTQTEKVELAEVTLDPIARPQATQRGAGPDVVAVADRFSTIANAPKPPPPPVADTTQPGGAGTPMPPVAPPTQDNIKYLGHVGLGATLFAMITENQRQAVVGLNDELSAGRVVEITPDTLTLDRDGARKVIELAAKSGSAISTVMPMSASTRGTRGGPRGQVNPQDIMARSRTQAPPPPQIVMMNGPEQRRQQAWDDHFNTATNRLMESGKYKDEGEAKQAAARYAEEMVKVEEEIIQGADPEEIEKRRKDLDEMFAPGSSK